MPIEVIYTTRSHNWSTTRIKDLITKQTILQNPSIVEENVKSLTADEAAKIINNK
jgi:sulfur carrier protein ThiS